ncbi:hypothetical protein [Endozoicomonas sp. ALD040]|uniref:hypothetical protein n=1 Tax=Endozoicomonas sp. ALD040 TaxID=3403079 RepID=UPI003BB2062A
MIYHFLFKPEGRDIIIKHSLFPALLLLSLSVACQAEPLTICFVIEPEQNADCSNHNFFIKLDQQTLSDKPPDIADTNGYTEPYSSPDKIRRKTYNYGVKKPLIKSISWHWLYATNLLVTYNLILTTKDTSQSPTPYSLLPLEVIITLGWLLKNYWNPDSLLFNPIEQQEASQHHPFAITTMMAGSEQDRPQYQSSQSSVQHPPQVNTHFKGYYTSHLYSDSGGGNEDPEQYLHTLGLNCFIYPCNGVCRFRQSSDPSNSVNGVASDGVILNSIAEVAADSTSPAGQITCNVIVLGKDGLLQQCGRAFKNAKVLSVHKSTYHTGQKTCDATVVGEDYQERLCGRVYKNTRSLTYHKYKYHSRQKPCDVVVVDEDGQRRPCGTICIGYFALKQHKSRKHAAQETCNVTVIGEDGQPQSCGKVYKNALSLSCHKSNFHSGRQSCNVNVVGENGKLRPCGKVCRNAQALSYHKRSFHTVQQTCHVTVVGKGGHARECGKVLNNAQSLSVHKYTYHTGQQTCDVTVVGGDGQQRPCRKVYKNAQALSHHKSSVHTGQQTCDVVIVGKNGQQRPCGTVCMNALALRYHKKKVHSGQQICDMTVVAEDSQQRPCRRVCKSNQDLSNHKRRHRKRKSVDSDQGDDLTP